MADKVLVNANKEMILDNNLPIKIETSSIIRGTIVSNLTDITIPNITEKPKAIKLVVVGYISSYRNRLCALIPVFKVNGGIDYLIIRDGSGRYTTTTGTISVYPTEVADTTINNNMTITSNGLNIKCYPITSDYYHTTTYEYELYY